MLRYPISLRADTNATLLIGFPDFPSVNSVAESEAEAGAQAQQALETALQAYFDRRVPVPLPPPSPALNGEFLVTLPALSEAKVLIWNEMCTQGLRKADLARLMKVHAPQIDRLFDLAHASKLDFVEQAAKALGKTLIVSFE